MHNVALFLPSALYHGNELQIHLDVHGFPLDHYAYLLQNYVLPTEQRAFRLQCDAFRFSLQSLSPNTALT